MTDAASALIDFVIPVYNEEDDLATSTRHLHAYLKATCAFDWRIVVADNASTDNTPRIAEALAIELPGVFFHRLARKGRGRALREAWLASDADVVAYMDVDLSTGLGAIAPLVTPLVLGVADVAIGSRLADGAHVARGPKREVISRCYNALLHSVMRARFSDAQCGFKAMRREAAQLLLPLVEDDGWFFDTELLLLAQHHRLRIHEVPVDWVDDADSRVDIVATALADLRGMWRMKRTLRGTPDHVAESSIRRSVGKVTTAPVSGRR